MFIYRNVIYMNRERGVYVKSAMDTDCTVHAVDNVYVINNTIAHNLLAGVLIVNARPDDEDEGETTCAEVLSLSAIYLYNNMIIRNGPLGGDDENADSMQVAWDIAIDWDSTTDFGSDYNCYLTYVGAPPKEFVIRGYSSSDGIDAKSLANAQTYWHIEDAGPGIQVSALGDLYLVADLLSSSLLTAAEADLYILITNYSLIDLATVEAEMGSLDYKVYEFTANTVNAAYDGTSALFGIYHYDTGTDIGLSPDIEGVEVSDLGPDMGAYEWTPESAAEHTS